MIEEVLLWMLYAIIIFSPLMYRIFKGIEFDDENELERLTRQVKHYSELYLDKTKTCEYCDTMGEPGDQYCHLCGTGLVIKNDDM